MLPLNIKFALHTTSQILCVPVTILYYGKTITNGAPSIPLKARKSKTTQKVDIKAGLNEIRFKTCLNASVILNSPKCKLVFKSTLCLKIIFPPL